MGCRSNSSSNQCVDFRLFFKSFRANILLQGEKFADTKKRLQARIGVSDKDLAKYRFALIQVSTFKQPSYIEDGEFICAERRDQLLTLVIR
jgi:hypothetical protein